MTRATQRIDDDMLLKLVNERTFCVTPVTLDAINITENMVTYDYVLNMIYRVLFVTHI